MRFADDKALVCNTEEGLQQIVDGLVIITEEFGMRMNVNKTKVMRIARREEESIEI